MTNPLEGWMYQPLSGIRILDLSRLVPGPYLTQLLVNLGAEVIKVETPGLGDHARAIPSGMGLWNIFEMLNRGKKSVAINYRNPRGLEVFIKLAGTADVILENFRPGVAKRLKMDYESLQAAKPDLIYCALSGYGQTGPYRQRAGHDLNYLAISGALSLNARENEAPVPYGVTVADLSGAMLAGIAILSALVEKQRTGRGAFLDVALLDGALSWMAPLAGAAYFNGLPVTGGTLALQGGLACYNIYETADGKYLSLGALEPSFWGDFCNITGRADLLSRQFDRTIKAEVAAVFKQRTLADWLEAFSKSDGCVEPVISFEEMLTHPQVKARGFVRTENGTAVGLNAPFVFARGEPGIAPGLGEHTDEILKDILSHQEINELTADGIIGRQKGGRIPHSEHGNSIK
jgi:crotonobetainyl-CoA:carnitine CoA-transferase CaiB-like acyl-CoA transferase